MIKAKPRYQGKPKELRWHWLLAIAVFHVAALYGLASLLAPDFTASMQEEVGRVLTVTVTAPEEEPDPETPPEPDEGASGNAGKEAVPEPVTAPPSRIETRPEPRPEASSAGTADRSGATEAGDGTGREGAGLGTGSGNQGGGQGNGIAVKPSVRSGSLDPRRDFPAPEGGRSVRYGTSVTVVFTVQRDGRATNCSVARTSSDAATTALVCALVMEKIRFNPARRQNGEPVAARYGYRVDFRER